jgi:hypothetical protein
MPIGHMDEVMRKNIYYGKWFHFANVNFFCRLMEIACRDFKDKRQFFFLNGCVFGYVDDVSASRVAGFYS